MSARAFAPVDMVYSNSIPTRRPVPLLPVTPQRDSDAKVVEPQAIHATAEHSIHRHSSSDLMPLYHRTSADGLIPQEENLPEVRRESGLILYKFEADLPEVLTFHGEDLPEVVIGDGLELREEVLPEAYIPRGQSAFPEVCSSSDPEVLGEEKNGGRNKRVRICGLKRKPFMIVCIFVVVVLVVAGILAGVVFRKDIRFVLLYIL